MGIERRLAAALFLACMLVSPSAYAQFTHLKIGESGGETTAATTDNGSGGATIDLENLDTAGVLKAVGANAQTSATLEAALKDSSLQAALGDSAGVCKAAFEASKKSKNTLPLAGFPSSLPLNLHPSLSFTSGSQTCDEAALTGTSLTAMADLAKSKAGAEGAAVDLQQLQDHITGQLTAAGFKFDESGGMNTRQISATSPALGDLVVTLQKSAAKIDVELSWQKE